MKCMAICVAALQAAGCAWCGYRHRVPMLVVFGLMWAFAAGVGFMELVMST